MKQSLGAKTIVLPAPVFLVGSYDGEDRPNVMNAAWGGLCASKPPSVAVSIRESRYTYANIVRHQAFTINIPPAGRVREADYVGMASGRDTDKFEDSGLTPVKSELVHAPYVAEFPLVLECKVIQTSNLGSHVQFVGEILDVKVDSEVLDEDGAIDVTKVQPFCFSPADGGYYRIGPFIAKAFSVGKDIGQKDG